MGVPMACAYYFGEGAISAIRDRIRAREYVGQDPEAQIRALQRHGCQLVSLTEAIDTGTPGRRLVFVMFAALAELEADLARERTGLAARLARGRGDLWRRRSPFHDPKHVRRVQSMLRDKRLLKTEIAKSLGIDVSTLYKWFPGGNPDAYPGIHTGVPV